MANAGLALMVGGFLLRPWFSGAGQAALAVGGIGSAVGAFLFIFNIWWTLSPVAALVQPLRPAATERITT